MKRRITSAIVGVTAFVLLLLGIPLAILVQREVVSSEIVEMQSDAASALTEIELPINADQIAAIAAESDAPSPFSVYDSSGQLVYGEGPTPPDEPTQAAIARRTAHSTDGDIVVAMPITDSEEHVAGALRLVDARGGTDGRVRSAWAMMLLSAAVAIERTESASRSPVPWPSPKAAGCS